MADTTHAHPWHDLFTHDRRELKTDHARQAFYLLHVTFVVAPLLAGLDKFTNLLTDWSRYISPFFARLMPFSTTVFLRVVGVVEIGAALLVAIRPRIGGYVVAAWLGVIIVNLLSFGKLFDIALRDFGLALAALALARLSVTQSAH